MRCTQIIEAEGLENSVLQSPQSLTVLTVSVLLKHHILSLKRFFMLRFFAQIEIVVFIPQFVYMDYYNYYIGETCNGIIEQTSYGRSTSQQ